MTLKGYELTAQRLLQTVFDGGCADTCIGRCVCRDELAEALGIAREEGRLEMRKELALAPRPRFGFLERVAFAAAEGLQADDPELQARWEAAQSQAERLGEQDA